MYTNKVKKWGSDVIKEKFPGFSSEKAGLAEYIKIFETACLEDNHRILEGIQYVADNAIIKKLLKYGKKNELFRHIKQAVSLNALITMTAASGEINLFNEFVDIINSSKLWKTICETVYVDAMGRAIFNGHLNIVNRFGELVSDGVKLDKIIFRHPLSNNFNLAVTQGHLSIMNRLVELISDPKKLEEMVTASSQTLYSCLNNKHLLVVHRLLELTPEPEKKYSIISSTFKKLINIEEGRLEINQYLLSFAPELKATALAEEKNEELRKRIDDSDNLIQKIIEIRKTGLERSVEKFFEYIKFGKSVFNIILAAKTSIDQLQDLLILDPVDYLGDQDVSLTRKEKIWVLNALSTPRLHLEDNRNSQDKKVSFVERVLAQKAIGKSSYGIA